MINVTEVRLTLYALISAIETDLRTQIKKFIIPHFQDTSFINDQQLEKRCRDSFEKENPGLNAVKNYELLIDYVYFQDNYKILLANKQLLPTNLISHIKKNEANFNGIIPIRNRVMHHRPLLSGDYSTVFNLAYDLHENEPKIWIALSEVLQNIEDDPSFIFTYNIEFSGKSVSTVYNNLPMPDFDESGFIGRIKDSEDIKKLLLGTNRVVSIIGDGGVGKSSLILKVAYDILDLEGSPFDAIIWTSAKTRMLTASGILEIKDSISDFTSFVKEITEVVNNKSTDLNSNINEILEFMDNYKVLLIIDNLETIHDDQIKEFIREAQLRAKIAITSRLGLGELEYPKILEGFSENESAQLVREISRVRNSKTLKNLTSKQLSEISQQLHYNPLALKWFINSVDSGKNPNEVLNNKSDLLRFCLSNVYEKLHAETRLVLNTMLAARKPLNDAELHFLTSLEPLKLRKALIQLLTTTLIQRSFSSKNNISEPIYNISDFAREFLASEYPIDLDFIKNIIDKQKKLMSGFEEANRATMENEFSISAFSIRTINEKVITRYLQEAMNLSRAEIKDYNAALEKIKEARDIVPNYFETYRVSAFIKANKGDLIGAENDYKTALELEPNNPRLLYFFSGFLLHQMQDTGEALKYTEKAVQLKPEAIEPKILYARCKGYMGNFDEAIQILNSLDDYSIKFKAKHRKTISTMKIDFYKRWADRDIQINKDYNSAESKIVEIMRIFDNSIQIHEIDQILLKKFSIAFILYLQINKKCDSPEKVIEVFLKYNKYFKQSDNNEKIFRILIAYYGYSENQDSNNIDRFNGMINEIFHDKNYGFIQDSKLNTYFFHKNYLCFEDDWEKLNRGYIVEFNPEKSDKGDIAINVKYNE